MPRPATFALLALLALPSCKEDDGVDPGPDCLYVSPGDDEWCACNEDHTFCDGECDPVATAPFDYDVDGGDCSCEDYVAADADPMPTPCLPELEELEPFRVWISGRFAADPENGLARGFVINGEDVPMQIRVWITNPRYAQTRRPEDSCEVVLRPRSGTAPLADVTGSTTVDSTSYTHRHRGFTLEPGEFDIHPPQSANTPSCLDRRFVWETVDEPAEAVIGRVSWSLAVGELHPYWRQSMLQGDDPEDDNDVASLTADGLLGGASFAAKSGARSLHFAELYDVEPGTQRIRLDPDRVRGPWVRLAEADVVDPAKLPAGVYFVNAREGARPTQTLIGP